VWPNRLLWTVLLGLGVYNLYKSNFITAGKRSSDPALVPRSSVPLLQNLIEHCHFNDDTM